MKQYLDMLREVLTEGTLQENRTGVAAKFLPGYMLKFDLQNGFPIVTTRKAPFKMAVAETIGFLRGYSNAAQFRSLGCPFWDANANATPAWVASKYRKGTDDLGEIYGHFWRHWVGDDGSVHDQVMNLLHGIRNNPTSRRIIVNGWKVEAIAQGRGALPPCHIAWHTLVDVARQELSLCVWQRSADSVLGIGGGNIIGYAFLLELIARLVGLTPKWCVFHLDDVHVYQSHFDGVAEQLTRDPRPLPKLVFSDRVPSLNQTGKFEPEWIENIEPADVWLEGYDPHPAIKFEMAA